ncbi:hypothetical protein AGMMS50239_18530 [Bacteroidia bacterium]|nr:hypothetical protein AGMMS50239_18530 [Bacteroidia bacterium]
MKAKEEISFYEKQKMPWYFQLIPVVLLLVIIYPFIAEIRLGENIRPFPFIIAVIVSTSIVILYFIISLETIINETGIYIKMFPFMFKFKVFAWEIIENVEVRKYNPITEAGGWGWRTGITSSAYNLSGNKGLILKIKKNGFVKTRKILIRTQHPQEIQEILMKLGKNINV